MLIYAMLDKAMEEYGALVLLPTDEAAKRTLSQALKQDTMVASHPDDFDLMCLGKFDESTGLITGYASPRLVCNIGSYTRAEAQRRIDDAAR